MTNEQLAQLRKMSANEVFQKYTPLYLDGKLTKKQYYWLFDQIESDKKRVDLIADVVKEAFTYQAPPVEPLD